MNTAFDRGEVIGQRDLLDRFSYDCLWRAEAHGKRGVSACGVYLPDLDRDRSKCLIRPRTGLQIARHGPARGRFSQATAQPRRSRFRSHRVFMQVPVL